MVLDGKTELLVKQALNLYKKKIGTGIVTRLSDGKLKDTDPVAGRA